PGRSSSRAKARLRRCGRRSAPRIRRTPRPERFAAISPPRCPTTSCTAPTHRRRQSARSHSGSVSEPDYVALNRATWTKANAEYTDRAAREAWAREVGWGQWHIPESELHMLPDVAGKDVIELGC